MEIVIFPASFECIQRKLRANTKLYKLQTLDMLGVHGNESRTNDKILWKVILRILQTS